MRLDLHIDVRGYGPAMKVGVFMPLNDESIGPVALARALEDRGFDSLFLPSTRTSRRARIVIRTAQSCLAGITATWTPCWR
jgi:hypothetical protein